MRLERVRKAGRFELSLGELSDGWRSTEEGTGMKMKLSRSEESGRYSLLQRGSDDWESGRRFLFRVLLREQARRF